MTRRGRHDYGNHYKYRDHTPEDPDYWVKRAKRARKQRRSDKAGISFQNRDVEVPADDQVEETK